MNHCFGTHDAHYSLSSGEGPLLRNQPSNQRRSKRRCVHGREYDVVSQGSHGSVHRRGGGRGGGRGGVFARSGGRDPPGRENPTAEGEKKKGQNHRAPHGGDRG